jgi:ribosomal protein L11 methyltransferase
MPCPYEDLYIYQIEGRIDPAAAVEGQRFLGHWQEEDSAFLFFSAPAEQEVEAVLRRHPHLHLIDRTRLSYDLWQGPDFSGQRIGRFEFVAPWAAEAPGTESGADETSVLLDPGLVFGAGNHPTTADCLRALEQALDSAPAVTVLDLGTGSGILALAAAKLGARVLAVDLNPLAARTARRNVRLNQLEASILIVQGRAEEFIEAAADLVMANIHGEVMLRMLEAPGFRQKPRCILSGLMRSDAKEVRRRLALLGLCIIEEWVRDGVWHTYYAVRNA